MAGLPRQERSLESVVVFGGYGTFGRLVSAELAAAGVRVRIAGRDGERAAQAAAALGRGSEGIAADAEDSASSARALAGMRVAVDCAGPFDRRSLLLPEACLAAGVHYVDISEHRGWFARLAALDGRFRAAGLVAASGCSSLPGISGALAVATAARLGVRPEIAAARVALFIGNRNPKGRAAMEAARAQLGRPFPAPGGLRRGFCGRVRVALPPPFGRRSAFELESPELDLLPDLLGAGTVRVAVGFESRLANGAFGILGRLGERVGPALAGTLLPLAGALSRWGHSGGAVQVELLAADGRRAVASVGGAEAGQRMAALPAVWIAAGLLDGSVSARGFVTAYEALGSRRLLERLAAAGYEIREEAG
jgi:hypothetical protein